jgi:hypothetical protein
MILVQIVAIASMEAKVTEVDAYKMETVYVLPQLV